MLLINNITCKVLHTVQVILKKRGYEFDNFGEFVTSGNGLNCRDGNCEKIGLFAGKELWAIPPNEIEVDENTRYANITCAGYNKLNDLKLEKGKFHQ